MVKWIRNVYIKYADDILQVEFEHAHMPIITPCYRVSNAAPVVTKSTLRILRHEFSRGNNDSIKKKEIRKNYVTCSATIIIIILALCLTIFRL